MHNQNTFVARLFANSKNCEITVLATALFSEGGASSIDCLRNIVFGMRRAEEGSLKLGGGKVDARIKHLAKEAPESGHVGLRRTLPVCDGFGIEEPCKHGSGALCCQLDASIFCGCRYTVYQLCAEGFETGINLVFLFAQDFQLRHASRHGQ